MDQPGRDWRVLDEPEDPAPAAGRAAAIARLPLLVVGAAAVLAASIAATMWVAGTAGAGREVLFDAGSAPVASSSLAPQLVVDVGGAVSKPGLYRLPAGSRIADAIAAAGGFGPTIDAAAAAALNLAAPLQDGTKVQVPQRGAGARGQTATTGATGSQPPGLVNLNTATQAELENLPGIGPVTAKKIIDSRAETPFRSLDDLTARKLVGSSTFEKIEQLVTVGG
jgi:competence protein ComEA